MTRTTRKTFFIASLGALILCGCTQTGMQSGSDDGRSPTSKPAATSYQQELLRQIEDLKAEKKIAEDRLNDIRIRDNMITSEYNKLKLTVQQQDQQIKLIGEAITERDALKARLVNMQVEIQQLQKENQRLKSVIAGLKPASSPDGGK